MISDTGKELGIPNDPLNADWQRYQQWLAEGNTPLPDPDIAQEQAYQTKMAAIEAEVLSNLPSWQQVADAIAAAFPAGQASIIRKLARVIYVLARRELL